MFWYTGYVGNLSFSPVPDLFNVSRGLGTRLALIGVYEMHDQVHPN